MQLTIPKLIALLLVLGAHQLLAQETCLSFDLADTLNTDCGACVTLEAPFTQIYQTNTYNVSAIDPTPLYPLNVGNPVGVGIDDTWSEIIPLGFEFCFFDQTYTSIVLGSNGILTFNLANAGGFNEWNFDATCPSNQLPVNSIFMPYHDIDPSVCGTVRYQVYGEAPCRKFVVSYDEVCLFSCTTLQSSSQVVLSEGSNAIQVFVINKAPCLGWNDGNGLIGIQNAAGTVGFTPPGRNTGPWSASNEAWQFNPNGDELGSVAWFENGVEISNDVSVEVCPDSSKYYHAELRYGSCSSLATGECENYQVTVSAGTWPEEVSWNLINQDGTAVLSGGAPFNQNVCLPNACYTLDMLDSWGDGWNGAVWNISFEGQNQGSGTIANGTQGSSSFCLDEYVPVNEEEEGPPLWATDSIFVELNLPQIDEGIILPEILCGEDAPITLLANEPGGNWSSSCLDCLENDQFDPSNLTEGAYDVVYTLESVCGPIEQIASINIELAPEIELNLPEYVCLEGEVVNLTNDLPGGAWFSDCEACLNEENSTFEPSAGVGTYQLQYTAGENCLNTDSTIIEVLEMDVAAISLPSEWCVSSDLVLESNGTPGSWTSSCLECLNEDESTFLGLTNGAGLVQLNFTPEGQCPVTSSDSLVLVADVNAEIFGPLEVCESDDPIVLSAANDGGFWTSDCENCLSPEGVFTPNLVDAPEVSIEYSIEGTCADSDQLTILVLDELTAQIAQPNPICESASVILEATGDEGFWMADCGNCVNETTGLFDGTNSGPGTFSITYAFGSGCAQDASATIEVLASVNASISDLPPLCETSEIYLLQAQDNGGTWSADCGNCVDENGSFFPSEVGPGVYTISYEIEGVCSDEDEVFVEVLEQTTAEMFLPDFICLGTEYLELNAANSGGNWSADCADCIDQENQQLIAENLSIGEYLITYNVDGLCGDEQSEIIEVVPCDIVVPNVFTPNNDGVNDDLEFTNLQYFNGASLRVYNRWGQVVYESDAYKNNWKAEGISDGTYFFTLLVPNLIELQGEITILR